MKTIVIKKKSKLEKKVERYIAEFQAKVDSIRNTNVVGYISGKTNLDYAQERVKIWSDYLETIS